VKLRPWSSKPISPAGLPCVEPNFLDAKADNIVELVSAGRPIPYRASTTLCGRPPRTSRVIAKAAAERSPFPHRSDLVPASRLAQPADKPIVMSRRQQPER
jgi:hypothetical protein